MLLGLGTLLALALGRIQINHNDARLGPQRLVPLFFGPMLLCQHLRMRSSFKHAKSNQTFALMLAPTSFRRAPSKQYEVLGSCVFPRPDVFLV